MIYDIKKLNKSLDRCREKLYDNNSFGKNKKFIPVKDIPHVWYPVFSESTRYVEGSPSYMVPDEGIYILEYDGVGWYILPDNGYVIWNDDGSWELVPDGDNNDKI